MSSVPPPPLSPSVWARRKDKAMPTLSLSAFSTPTSGQSDRFPFPPSPSTVNPECIIDANVVVSTNDLSIWKSGAGSVLGEKISGVVLSLDQASSSDLASRIEPMISGIPVVSLSVPFSFKDGNPVGIPSSSKVPIGLSVIYTKRTPEIVDAVRWALEQGRVIDVDVQFSNDEGGYESLEDTLSEASSNAKEGSAIVLSNILPPADDLTLPLVKLLTHPRYQAYQSYTASLSLIPNTYVKFTPPSWHATTPVTPAPVAGVNPEESKEKREWKRRIKMYIAPTLEAFGYQRIMFGSSSSVSSQEKSSAGDWYELARECFAELGIEQEGVNAIFNDNAKKIYGSLE